jgi:hypothetical protein
LGGDDRPARTSDTGASAVEFALILPLFVMLVFGTISAGFMFETWLSVTQAARETSRYAATYPIPETSASPPVLDIDTWFNNVKNVAVDTAGIDESKPSSYLICIKFENQGTSPASEQRTYGTLGTVGDPCSGAQASTDNRVHVLIARAADLSVVLWSGNIDVEGKNISRYEPRLQ